MDASKLTEPFAEEELRHFEGRGGKTMTFIEDETVMDRLDAAFGMGNWQVHVEAVPIYEGVVKVRLGAKVGDEWVWHEDFGYPNQAGGDVLKESVSDGIRRCGRYFGIARDLYRKRTHEAPVRLQNGHSAPRPVAAPSRSSTHVPESVNDLDWDNLSPVKPGAVAVAERAEGTMWSKELFDRAETAGIEKRQISDTAKKMFGRDKWKVSELSDGERFALAVELGLV